MENKSLAYDYIYSYLFENENIPDNISTDSALSEGDRRELTNLFDVMKQVIENARLYNNSLGGFNERMMGLAEENMKDTTNTIIRIKGTLSRIIEDAKSAYKYVMWMYVLAFLLGIGLVITAIIFAAMGKTILSIAFGTIGLIDIVSHFIFKPPLELQSSRSNLTQLMIIVTNWFSDLMNLNGYISRNLIFLKLSELKEISDKQSEITTKMIKLLEMYAEPTNLKHNQPAPPVAKAGEAVAESESVG